QGGHGRRQGALGAGRDGSAGAPVQVPVSGGQDADHHRQREDGAGRRQERDGGRVDLQAGRGAGQLYPAAAAGDRRSVPDAGGGRVFHQRSGHGGDRAGGARSGEGGRRAGDRGIEADAADGV